MFLKLDPYTEEFKSLKAEESDHYDDDIGFSENYFIFNHKGVDYIASEPSNLGFACIQIPDWDTKEIKIIEDLLTDKNIPFEKRDFYC